MPLAEETFEYCRAHLGVRLGGSFIDIFQTPCTFGWHVQLQIPLQPHTHTHNIVIQGMAFYDLNTLLQLIDSCSTKFRNSGILDAVDQK